MYLLTTNMYKIVTFVPANIYKTVKRRDYFLYHTHLHIKKNIRYAYPERYTAARNDPQIQGKIYARLSFPHFPHFSSLVLIRKNLSR